MEMDVKKEPFKERVEDITSCGTLTTCRDSLQTFLLNRRRRASCQDLALLPFTRQTPLSLPPFVILLLTFHPLPPH